MGVLIIMMGVLFQFLGSAQKVWSLTETNTRIYENARVVFDVITRDLQSAVASDEAGSQIPFHYGYVDPNTGRGTSGTGAERNKTAHVAFVAVADPTTHASSTLAEIHYTCYWSGGGSSDRYWFRRARVCNKKNATTAEPKWDFYGDTSGAWAAPNSKVGLQKVVDGVQKITFTCYHPNGMSRGNTYTYLPKAVKVKVTLFDPKLVNQSATARARTARTFVKTIFLGSRG